MRCGKTVVGIAVRPFLAAALLFCVAGTVEATTTWGRGIVLEVGKGKDAKGNPTDTDVLKVFLTYSNYGAEGSVAGIEVPADALILLDGRLATREEAMKPGRLVKVLVDINYFEFYSTTGQFALPEPAQLRTADDGCYLLTLQDAVPMAPLLAAAKQTVMPTKASLTLRLDCRADGSVAGAALGKRPGSRVKGFGSPGALLLARGGYHDVDTRKLSVKDGRLSGEVTVHFFGAAKSGYRDNETPPVLPAEGPFSTATYTLDATLGEQGLVKGSYTGSVEQTAVTGVLEGFSFQRPVVPAEYSVWIRTSPRSERAETTDFGCHVARLGFQVRDGVVQPGYLSGGHDERLGELVSGTTSLDRNAFKVEAQATLAGAAVKLSVEATLLGANLVGRYRLTKETGEVCEGRLFGELLAYDCPSTEGMNERLYSKIAAKLKAERDAKQGEKP